MMLDKVDKQDLLVVLGVAFEATSFLEGSATDEYELERVERMNQKLHEVWDKLLPKNEQPVNL